MKMPSSRARLLIVDDNIEVQSVVKRAAEAAGFEVVQAVDGAPGLALATTEKFDLILLDSVMPTMHGHDFLRLLKQNPKCADVPVCWFIPGTMTKMIAALCSTLAPRILSTSPSTRGFW